MRREAGEAGRLESVRKYRERLFRGVEGALFVLMVGLLALIATQVFTRYVLKAAVPWTEEVARMVIVWVVMLGAAIAMDRNQHYAIRILSAHFKGKVRLWVLLSTNVLGVVFLTALVIYGAQYVAANMHTTYIALRVSRGWVYLALPTGGALMALSLISQSIESYLTRDSRRQDGQAPTALDV